MAHANGHIDNIQLGSHIADSSDAAEVIMRANKELAHGNWDLKTKDKVEGYVDELSGKQIKIMRADFASELKRLSDMQQAIRNAQRRLNKALGEDNTPTWIDPSQGEND